MATYTPQNLQHTAINVIADAEPLNAVNITKGIKDNADNTEYYFQKVVDVFKNVIRSMIKPVALDGFDLGLDGGEVAVTNAGRIIYRHMYADFGIQDISALVAATRQVYVKFGAVNKFSYTTTIHYAASVPADTTSDFYVQVATIDSTGGVSWVINRTEEDAYISELVELAHTQNTDTHTTASDFYVNGAPGVGKKVLTEFSFTPVSIFNFRVASVGGNGLNFLASGEGDRIGETFRTGGLSNTLQVKLKWGFDNIEGEGGDGTFTVDTAGLTLTNNQVAGAFLYIADVGNGSSINLLITSNTGNVLSVSREDETDWDGTDVIVASPAAALIHFNANSYEVTAIPAITGGGGHSLGDRIETQVSFGSTTTSPIQLDTILNLQVGTKYYLKIRGMYSGKTSNWIQMLAANTLDGLMPTLISNPYIADDGVIGANPERSGFTVTINGWEAPGRMFEIVYTTDSGGASFTNSAHAKVITAHRTYGVATPASANYNIKVRPLIGGYQVQDPLSIDVVSGAGGLLPQDQVLFSNYVTLKTFSGTATWTGATNGTVVLTNVKSPSGSTGSNITQLPSDLTGDIITDVNGTNFIITQVLAALTLRYTSVTNGVSSPSNGTFTINVSERGRQVIKFNQATINYELARLDVDCDVVEGGGDTTNGTVVRVYQQGRSADADFVIVNRSDAVFTGEMDVLVLSTYGERNIIVDLWDPSGSGPLTGASFAGRVTVYARPYRDRRIDVET